MFYNFPRIEFLSDVLPAIEGRDEFIVARRDWGHVVNYMVNFADTFPDPNCAPDSKTARNWAIRRECRGILFNNERRIISRPLHKFKNVGESDDYQPHLIDLGRPHKILEKLDGSFVRPLALPNGEWTMATKMGDTDIAQMAQEWIQTRKNYREFCEFMIRNHWTPVFEFCSRKQRIVIDYPVDRLVLLAVRNNVTGDYLPLEEFVNWELDVVQERPGSVDDIHELVETTRPIIGQEGWVLRFDTGHMAKIKAADYVRIHKARDSLSQEKNVIDLILNSATDDIKSMLPDEERQRLEKFETGFWQGVAETVEHYQNMFDTVFVEQCGSERKRFAVDVVPGLTDSWAAGVMFAAADGKSIREQVIDRIVKNLSTQNRVDKARSLWNNRVTWNYSWDGDA